jgi:hypothetical protein
LTFERGVAVFHCFPLILHLDPTPVSEAPKPLPAEGTWTGDAADLPNWNAMPRRNRRRRRRTSYPIWLKYLAWCFGVAALITTGQIAWHAVRSDPRDAKVFAERQLNASALRSNERVLAAVSVWQRPAIDYFRPTRGLLVLTDAPGDSANPVGGRIIYLGLQPRDPLSPADAPPTFDERDWPVDTLVSLTPTRTLMYLSRAISITTPRERLTLGIPSPAAATADTLLQALNRKYSLMRAVGWQRREARRALDRARVVAVHEGRREWFHTVRRGEALASVAKLYGTTPEEIRALNGIEGDRIKIGQALKVKGWTKNPVPFPTGIVPDSTPGNR